MISKEFYYKKGSKRSPFPDEYVEEEEEKIMLDLSFLDRGQYHFEVIILFTPIKQLKEGYSRFEIYDYISIYRDPDRSAQTMSRCFIEILTPGYAESIFLDPHEPKILALQSDYFADIIDNTLSLNIIIKKSVSIIGIKLAFLSMFLTIGIAIFTSLLAIVLSNREK